jgi:N utilization substance protein B
MVVDPAPTHRPGTRNPHQSRERALKVLFQADLRDRDITEILDGVVADPEAVALLDDADLDDIAAPDEDVASDIARLDEYARALVIGVATRLAEIDGVIERFSRRWTVQRMPVVDRNVLRLATYELLHEATPPAVVIDEALELAKLLSTDNSGRFVNGVLESIRQWTATLPEDAAADGDDADDDAGG